MAAAIYDAGIVEGERPPIIHAARLKSRGPDGPGYCAAVCNAMTLIPTPVALIPMHRTPARTAAASRLTREPTRTVVDYVGLGTSVRPTTSSVIRISHGRVH
jgi:hypothetical protein